MNLLVVLAVVLVLALIAAISVLVRTELKAKRPVSAAPRAEVTGREALDAIDLGLRRLAADCRRSGRSLPDVYALGYTGAELALRLTDPDAHAPAPWTSDEEGEEWRAQTTELSDAGVDVSATQPYPLAVTVGIHKGERVLVDLSRASAPISVTGDGEAVRQLVRALVTELITGPVGRRAEVTLVGSAATAEMTVGLGLMSARLHTVATLDEGLTDGADQTSGRERTGSTTAVTQVFRLIEGGGPVGVQGRAPRLFVLHAAQFVEERAAMTNLHTADALLVLGEAPDFAWRFHVSADGSLDTGPLGLWISTHAGRLA
ncbi:hypothetical protein [Streptomyces sp. NPDC048527]|uniref:hypothetical protein n=1 Tax=Streptomyces sp. NPDC048527 TaxID=3365568 RepID=UPI00371453C3